MPKKIAFLSKAHEIWKSNASVLDYGNLDDIRNMQCSRHLRSSSNFWKLEMAQIYRKQAVARVSSSMKLTCPSTHALRNKFHQELVVSTLCLLCYIKLHSVYGCGFCAFIAESRGPRVTPWRFCNARSDTTCVDGVQSGTFGRRTWMVQCRRGCSRSS